jgi:hypothetical protein
MEDGLKTLRKKWWEDMRWMIWDEWYEAATSFFQYWGLQDDIGVFICQKKFVERILKILKMFGCKLVDVHLMVNEKANER